MGQLFPANGPAAAAVLAGGIGCATLGIATTLGEASHRVGDLLNWYKPVGSLAGKTGVAVIAFLASWILLNWGFRDRDVRFGLWATIALGLVALGFLLTFPPVFELLFPAREATEIFNREEAKRTGFRGLAVCSKPFTWLQTLGCKLCTPCRSEAGASLGVRASEL